MAPENSFEPGDTTTVDTVDGKLDLEAIIARFAGDDSRVSHALPASLSPEQRQLAKKLVGHHPQLECESYGFGPERQLHLFKKRTGCNGVRMRVKNTFIDAWLEGGEGKLGCSPISRSLPSDWRSVVVAALVTPGPDKCESTQDLDHICSTPSSCTSFTFQNTASSLMLTQVNVLVEPTDPHSVERTEGAQVCSTPSPRISPKSASCAVNSIPVLSKAHDPHGTELMSSERNKELHHQSKRIQNRTAVLLPPPESPSNVAMLSGGTAVEIEGLRQRPDFNGLSGTVRSWDPIMRRYDVLLDNLPGRGGPRHVKLKRENLRLRPPPPPSEAAPLRATTIDLDRCLPQAVEAACRHGDAADRVSIEAAALSPAVSDGSAWYSWQFYDSGMSPHSWRGNECIDDACPPCDEAQWEFSANVLNFTDNTGILSFDAPGSVGWQPSICETGMEQNSWHPDVFAT